MNVIFTDIDGVLVKDKHCSVRMEDGFSPFSKSCVEAYNKLIELSNSKTVISSDWRKWEDINGIKNIFHNRYVECDIIDYTDILMKTMSMQHDRGLEIEKWLYDHSDIDNFVILDDNIDGIIDYFPNNTVKCNSIYGLTLDNVYQSLRILKVKL